MTQRGSAGGRALGVRTAQAYRATQAARTGREAGQQPGVARHKDGNILWGRV